MSEFESSPQHLEKSISYRDADSLFLLEILQREPTRELLSEVVIIAMGRALGNEFDRDAEELFLYAYALQEQFDMDAVAEVDELDELFKSSEG